MVHRVRLTVPLLPSCRSNAAYSSASKEKDSSRNHQIDDDGYNLGRDFLVERAIAGTHWQGLWWRAEVEWRTGLMPHGKKGASDHQQR